MTPRLIAAAAVGALAALLFAGAGWVVGRTLRAATPPVLVGAERLTAIPLLRPAQGEAQGLAIVVSDTGGWSQRGDDFVKALRARGLAVLPVDLEAWRERLDASDGECLYLGSDLENLAKEALRTLGNGSYFHPVIAGLGEGGTLAYAAIADAPAATFAGAVALDPAPALRTRLPTCPGAAATAAPGGGFSYALDAALPAPAALVVSENPAGLAQSAPPAQFTAEAVVRDKGGPRTDAALDAVSKLAAEDAASADLPTVDIPAEGTPSALVVFYSGDGGWRDLDKTIGEALAGRGIHVVGVDSLRYFWSERKPAEIAKDLGTIVAQADPGAKLPVVVLGYSFGADAFPFAWTHLPPALKDRIRMVGLLGTENTTPFQVTVGGWLGMGGDNPVAPAVATIPLDRVVCLYGEDETLTVCEDPTLKGMETRKLEGGHHFDGDYEAVADYLLGEIRKRTGGAATQ